MSTKTPPQEKAEESTATAITGPWAEFDKHDQYTGYDYYRCEQCGVELLVSIVRDGGFDHAPNCPEGGR
jgi:hypothetical protein